MYRLITTSALILGVALSCLVLPGVGTATAAKPTGRVAAKKGAKKPTARLAAKKGAKKPTGRLAAKKGVKKPHHRNHRRRFASFGKGRHQVRHHHHHHRRGMHGARRF